MAACFAIVERVREGCGPGGNETWVNVVVGVMRTNQTKERLLAAGTMGSEGWNQFLVEITEQEFYSLNNPDNVFEDEERKTPRYQQRAAVHGGGREFGEFEARGSRGSRWIPEAERLGPR